MQYTEERPLFFHIQSNSNSNSKSTATAHAQTPQLIATRFAYDIQKWGCGILVVALVLGALLFSQLPGYVREDDTTALALSTGLGAAVRFTGYPAPPPSPPSRPPVPPPPTTPPSHPPPPLLPPSSPNPVAPPPLGPPTPQGPCTDPIAPPPARPPVPPSSPPTPSQPPPRPPQPSPPPPTRPPLSPCVDECTVFNGDGSLERAAQFCQTEAWWNRTQEAPHLPPNACRVIAHEPPPPPRPPVQPLPPFPPPTPVTPPLGPPSPPTMPPRPPTPPPPRRETVGGNRRVLNLGIDQPLPPPNPPINPPPWGVSACVCILRDPPSPPPTPPPTPPPKPPPRRPPAPPPPAAPPPNRPPVRPPFAPNGRTCEDNCTNLVPYLHSTIIVDYSNDGSCDDGGPDASFSACAYGLDCFDCGPRAPS
jgi:hypothetical protein